MLFNKLIRMIKAPFLALEEQWLLNTIQCMEPLPRGTQFSEDRSVGIRKNRAVYANWFRVECAGDFILDVIMDIINNSFWAEWIGSYLHAPCSSLKIKKKATTSLNNAPIFTYV